MNISKPFHKLHHKQDSSNVGFAEIPASFTVLFLVMESSLKERTVREGILFILNMGCVRTCYMKYVGKY